MTTDIRRIEGLQTVSTVQESLGLQRQSAINLLSRLRKRGFVTSEGGGKQPRLYRITRHKQLPRAEGMFDLLNKHNPWFKLNEWYDHQVHGKYTEEDAILDAIETESFRALLATLRVFNHVTDWPRLYKQAKERGLWNKVGALYDVARLHFRTRRMPERYRKLHEKRAESLIKGYGTTEELYKPITQEWGVEIPFRKGDIRKVMDGW